jgi:hypothetical protein
MMDKHSPEPIGSTGAAVMNEKSAAAQRIHSEAPSEGDIDADPTDLRMHSQDPAEGADTDDEEAGEPGPDK